MRKFWVNLCRSQGHPPWSTAAKITFDSLRAFKEIKGNKCMCRGEFKTCHLPSLLWGEEEEDLVLTELLTSQHEGFWEAGFSISYGIKLRVPFVVKLSLSFSCFHAWICIRVMRIRAGLLTARTQGKVVVTLPSHKGQKIKMLFFLIRMVVPILCGSYQQTWPFLEKEFWNSSKTAFLPRKQA